MMNYEIPQLVFLTGASGSGKSFFFENRMPAGAFYKLKSMTTRLQRPGEFDGLHYYFFDETNFFSVPRATTLFVNEKIWAKKQKKFFYRHEIFKPFQKLLGLENKKWLYGVPESEFEIHAGENLVYDVIEPKYIRQMIDWMVARGLNYNPVILHFLSPENNFEIAAERAVMEKDLEVRKANTCTEQDFKDVGLTPDFTLLSCAKKEIYPPEMMEYFKKVAEGKLH
jgi:hypothetical protein